MELCGNRSRLQRRAGQRHRRGVSRLRRPPRHAPHQLAGSHHGWSFPGGRATGLPQHGRARQVNLTRSHFGLFFFVHFSQEMFQPSPLLLSVSFSASTSRHGTPIRSGWWICRTTRTSKRCVWVRAGRRLLPTRWCSDSSPSAECRGKSSAYRGPWSAWLDTESSCSSYTTGVRHTHTHFLELS